MRDSLHRRLRLWHDGLVVLCCAFLVAQTIGLAHQWDLTKHVDQTTCHICQAIGHAAVPPAQAHLPSAAPAFGFTVQYARIVAASVRPTLSPHAPRAPPTLL